MIRKIYDWAIEPDDAPLGHRIWRALLFSIVFWSFVAVMYVGTAWVWHR